VFVESDDGDAEKFSNAERFPIQITGPLAGPPKTKLKNGLIAHLAIT
jgi:hypothetical protein